MRPSLWYGPSRDVRARGLRPDNVAADRSACRGRRPGGCSGSVWQVVGTPRQEGLVVLDLDATLVIARSDREWAPKSSKKAFGRHPLLGYVDHGGAGGTGSRRLPCCTRETLALTPQPI